MNIGRRSFFKAGAFAVLGSAAYDALAYEVSEYGRAPTAEDLALLIGE